MPIDSQLKRILHLRELQQDQNEAALKAASVTLDALRQAAQTAHERQQRARGLLVASTGALQPVDRRSSLCEAQIAVAQKAKLDSEILRVENILEQRLEELKATHRELRKGQLLLEAVEQKALSETRRRNQEQVDELHSLRSNPSVARLKNRSRA